MLNRQNYLENILRFWESRTDDELENYVAQNRLPLLNGTILYRYSKITEDYVKTLTSGSLYLSDPHVFNDPFDALIHKASICGHFKQAIKDRVPQISVSRKPYKKISYDSSLNQKPYEEYNKLISETIRIACFTEYNPKKLLMWSLYGNKHEGMCLEYNFSKCNDKEIIERISPVIYLKQPKNTKLPTIKHRNSLPYKFYLQTLLSKNVEFEFETEWRLIRIVNQPLKTGTVIQVPCLQHIYLGVNANQDNNEYYDLINFAKNNKIKISKMQRSPNKYCLYPVDIK